MYPMLHNAVTISLLAMFIDEKSSLVRPPAAKTQAELVKLVDHVYQLVSAGRKEVLLKSYF